MEGVLSIRFPLKIIRAKLSDYRVSGNATKVRGMES